MQGSRYYCYILDPYIDTLLGSLLNLGRYSNQVRLYLYDLQITIQAARRHLLSRQYLSFALSNLMTDKDTEAGPTVL